MQNPIMFFLVTLGTLPLILLGVLLGQICRLFRNIVIGSYLRSKYGKGVKFLTGYDALYAMDKPNNRMYIRSYFVVKDKPNISAYRERLTTKWINSTLPDNTYKLSHRLVCELGYYFWVPEKDFKIEQHCYVHDVVPRNDHELNAYFKEFLNKEYDKDLSPWSFTCINLDENFPGLEPGPHHLLLIIGHHALCDGINYAAMCNNYLIDQGADYKVLNKNNLKNVSLMTKLHRLIRVLVFGPGVLVVSLLTSPDKHILHGQTLSGTRLFASSKPMSLDRIKKVKNMTKTTVNDVLTSCITGGLRSYFLKEGVSPKSSKHVVPVAMHALNKPPKMENRSSALIFHDAADQATPIDRLLRTNENMNKLKTSELALTYGILVPLTYNYIPKCIMCKVSDLCGCTTVTSNVPGSPNICHIFGQKVVQFGLFTPTMAKTGMGICAITYNNEFRYGINADVALVKTQENLYRLIDDIIHELEELEKSI